MTNTTALTVLLLMGGLSQSGSAHAKDGETQVNFHGTLIEPPPCIINNGDKVDVDFGDRVGINKVDGVNYRQDINYQIACDNTGSHSWALSLSLSGTKAAFDGDALATNVNNLGIRIYQNGQPFTPGSSVDVSGSQSIPRLEAVPVKNAGSALPEGAFEAGATLRADYQ